MDKISDFEGLVGKELDVALDDENSVPIKVVSVTALTPIETEEDVNKEPFCVSFSSELPNRIPAGIHKVSVDGKEAQIYIDPCDKIGHEEPEHSYEAIFG